MTEPPDGATLVGSGSFKVDRGRALEKLMAYQLPDPWEFILPLLRCAAASKATTVRIAFNVGIEVQFDGRPFAREELQDPYSCLFEKRGEEGERGRHLAVGLLSALSLGPERILVASGRGTERVCLSIASLTEQSFLETRSPNPSTALQFGLQPGTAQARWPALLAERCRLSPLAVELQGRRLQHAWEDDQTLLFQAEPLRALLWPASPQAEESRLRLHLHGVVAGEGAHRFDLVQVEGAVDDPRFTLNASQTAVVRNAACKRALDALDGPVQELVRRTAAGQADRLQGLPRLLQEDAWRQVWHAALGGTAGGSGQPLFTFSTLLSLGKRLFLDPERLREVERAGRLTAWLRKAAAGLPKTGAHPLRSALADAPLLFDVEGRPLLLKELAEQEERLGHVPYSPKPLPGLRLPFRAAWAVSDSDLAFLRSVFPRGLRLLPEDEALQRLIRQGGAEEGSPLLQAGHPKVLARAPLSTGAVEGEVGLLNDPPHSGARVHSLLYARPDAYLDLGGGLRFTAAVRDRRADHRPDEKALREAGAAARSAARPLYMALAKEHSCWLGDPASVAAQGHLRDYLGERLAGRLSGPEDAWIEEVPLIAHGAERWSVKRLRLAVEWREPVLVGKPPEGPGWEPRPVLTCPPWDPGVLRSAAPGSELLPLPGADGLFLLTRLHRRPDCGHGACLLEWPTDGGKVHFAVGRREGGTPVAARGAVLSAYPAGEAPLPDLKGLHEERLPLELAAALLEQDRLPLSPNDPSRGPALDLLESFLAPWPGVGGDRALQYVHELLRFRPVLRRAHEAPVTLQELAKAASRKLAYADEDEARRAPSGTLLLDERERRFVLSLWPELRLLDVVENPRRAAPSPAAPGPAASKAPSAPPEPALFAREYEAGRIRVKASLPPGERPPRLERSVRGGPPESLDAAALGALVDLAFELPDGADESLGWLASEWTNRFLGELCEAWPPASPGSAQHAAAADRVAALLAASRRAPKPLLWPEVEESLRALPLVPVAGGMPISLAVLEERASAAKGVLAHVRRGGERLPPEAKGLPILSAPEAVAQALGGPEPLKLAAWDARAEPAPETAPAGAAGRPRGSDEPPHIKELRRLVNAVRKLGSGAAQVPVRKPARIRRQEGRRVLELTKAGRWVIDEAHPLLRAVLSSKLPDAEKAAYLASVAFSSANRELRDFTDEDDLALQQALAALVASEDRGGRAAEEDEDEAAEAPEA